MTDREELVRVRPERFVAGGEALAHGADGRIVFVRGGVPGDEVDARVVEHKDAWSRAVVTDVVTAAPERVEPPCPQRRLGCGGCDWQQVAEPAQLGAKTDVVRDAFRRTARMPGADIRPGSSVDPVGYRTSVRVVGGDDGAPSYRLDRSHDTVAAAGCLVVHPGLADLLERLTITPGLEVSLRVSAATGERTARWDRRGGDVTGLPADVGIGPQAVVHEDVAGHRFRVSAGSFFQSGPQAAELLVDAVQRAAPELATALVVVDAYAGVGLFAVAATSPHSGVTTIENSRLAVADARVNLSRRAAQIEAMQVGQWRPPTGLSIDVLIADPARSGLGKPGVAAVRAAGAEVVVLVSCDPVAAARDAALLATHGYRHDGTEVLDLFPHTHHVECVTRFVRAD